jgi:hypothetical protein
MIMLNHKILRLVVAFGIGLFLALYAYERITDPVPRQQRQQEEAVVREARAILTQVVGGAGKLKIVDPVSPDRKIGKVYIYPIEGGWEVSGHYQRGSELRWHPWLMTLNEQRELVSLLAQDDAGDLQAIAADDPRITLK